MKRLNRAMFKPLRWLVAGGIFVFGLLVIDLETGKWFTLTLLLYSIPLLFQLSRSFKLWYSSIWFGIFLILQALLSLLSYGDYKTLRPNLNIVFDPKGHTDLGIYGLQSITTDNKGFRTSGRIRYDEDGSFRIFAIGGSTTEQLLIDDRKTWCHQLQEKLSQTVKSDVEVINTGLSGLRAKHHLATLEVIVDYNPDLVIVLVGINDWNHQIVERFKGDSFSVPFGDYRESLLLRNTMLGNALYGIKHAAARTLGAGTPENYDTDVAERSGSLNHPTVYSYYPETVDPNYIYNLKAISDKCGEVGVDCLFVTQPSAYHADVNAMLKARLWMTPPFQEFTLDFESMIHIASLYNNYLIEFAATNNHYLCDISSEFKPSHNYLYDDCHFNEKGTNLFAEALFACIKQHILDLSH